MCALFVYTLPAYICDVCLVCIKHIRKCMCTRTHMPCKCILIQREHKAYTLLIKTQHADAKSAQNAHSLQESNTHTDTSITNTHKAYTVLMKKNKKNSKHTNQIPQKHSLHISRKHTHTHIDTAPNKFHKQTAYITLVNTHTHRYKTC